MNFKIRNKNNLYLYIQIILGLFFGLLCYMFDYFIGEYMNFPMILVLIIILSYYFQKELIFSFIGINNLSTSELISSSVMITIHCFVFWTLLLNIF